MTQFVKKCQIVSDFLSRPGCNRRGKHSDARTSSEGLNSGDVVSAINGRRMRNRHGGTDVTRKFLNAVDASRKALPHTNEAAKAARGLGEAMQHHFGMSSVFLTVTFDDENSVIMIAFSERNIDDDMPVNAMSDAELSRRAKLRRETRLELPGLASVNFEMLLEIVMDEVVGWDMKNHCATEHVGHFGIPHALSFAVEEQGRKTPHAHMTFYIKGHKDPQNDFFFKTGRQKLSASRTLRRYHEHVASTRLFPERKLDALKAFDHECTVDTIRQRSLPAVVDDQGLRNLWNKQGYKDTQGHFATCPHCLKKWWTCEDLVASCVIQDNAFCQPILDADSNLATTTKAGSQIPKARMLAKVLEFQKNGAQVPDACVNYACQHHLSCHVSNCFKCQKKGSKRGGYSCGPTCECRHRLPDRKRPTAEIMIESEGKKTWNSILRLCTSCLLAYGATSHHRE